MPWPVPKCMFAMTRLSTQWPPLIAIWSSQVLIVEQAMTPQYAMLLAPGSIPSVVRAQLGVSCSPRLLHHFDGGSTGTPQTMNPFPGDVQVGPFGPSGPSLGNDVSLTWNLAELCSVIL